MIALVSFSVLLLTTMTSAIIVIDPHCDTKYEVEITGNQNILDMFHLTKSPKLIDLLIDSSVSVPTACAALKNANIIVKCDDGTQSVFTNDCSKFPDAKECEEFNSYANDCIWCDHNVECKQGSSSSNISTSIKTSFTTVSVSTAFKSSISNSIITGLPNPMTSSYVNTTYVGPSNSTLSASYAETIVTVTTSDCSGQCTTTAPPANPANPANPPNHQPPITRTRYTTTTDTDCIPIESQYAGVAAQLVGLPAAFFAIVAFLI